MSATEAIRGWDGVLGLASESAWGTSVTPSTYWLPYTQNGIMPKETVEPVPYMATVKSTQAAHVRLKDVLTKHDCAGDITTTFRYEDKAFAMMLAHLFDALPTDSGAGPYDHTYTLAAAGALAGLTGQNVLGAHSSLDRAQVMPGMVVNSLELTVPARGLVTAKFGVIAQKANAPGAISGTVAITAAQEATGAHLAALSWNSTTYRPNSLTLKIDRQLEARENIGSGLYTDKPMPKGETLIELSFEIDWTSHDFETARAAETQDDAVLTFTGSGNNAAEWTVHGAQVVDVGRDSGNAHRRTQTVRMMGRYVDDTKLGAALVLTNDNATAT